MPVGALLSGLIAPLVVNSLLSGGAKTGEVSHKDMMQQLMLMQLMQFNVNFYNQDTNNNKDKNDVHDKGM